jgi:hypothetical protein
MSIPLIEEAKALFSETVRPEHFTNYKHCSECAEHDETLCSHNPDTISLNELGNPAWDPICFVTPEAFKYYFPALVRLAVEGTGENYYLDQFLFHLESDGPKNDRWRVFSTEQRQFVVKLLDYFIETRAEEIDRNLDADRLLRTLEVWSERQT